MLSLAAGLWYSYSSVSSLSRRISPWMASRMA